MRGMGKDESQITVGIRDVLIPQLMFGEKTQNCH